MASSGYFGIGRWEGAPILLHWTAPLGAFVFSGFSFAPAFWFAYLFLIFVHEAGHAVFVRAQLGRLVSIEIHGLGGLCRWRGNDSRGVRAFIAWGGVAGQALLFGATVLVRRVLGPPTSVAGHQIFEAFTATNVYVALFNLLPFRPLDGAEAWPGLFSYLWSAFRGLRRAKRTRVKKPAHLRLLEKQAEGDELLPELKETVDRILEESAKGKGEGPDEKAG